MYNTYTFIFNDDKGTVIRILANTEWQAKQEAINKYGLDRKSIKLYKKTRNYPYK